MVKLYGYLSVVLIIVFCSGMIYAEKPSTNEEFVINTVSTEFGRLLDSLEIANGDMQFKPQTGLSLLVVNGAKRAALNSGFKIVGDDQSLDSDDYQVNIFLSAFDFAYGNGSSRGFFKRGKVKRAFSGQMLVDISSDNFSYLGFTEFGGSDEVEPTEMNYIKSIRYNQLSPKPPGGGLKKYLEPLAVTATVGGLIYLFFINR